MLFRLSSDMLARMHELAITESIVAGVCERVAGQRVTRVILEIGRLSGVAADSIRFFFEDCARGTALEGASLEIVELPGRARCHGCGAELAAQDLFVTCGCAAPAVELVSGQQLLVKAVEVI